MEFELTNYANRNNDKFNLFYYAVLTGKYRSPIISAIAIKGIEGAIGHGIVRNAGVRGGTRSGAVARIR
ncbi:hypothetical protein [Paraburkholderia acidisoli]|uniref:Uncharacterized protein n=1 Tax=Paraburkholderia acidisoli TaxID=2571748 RepID=A0A7Z2GKJ2_9BURK|nr:hypothetical protein [Paraburkholderia acidisoli]QGZ63433.1 hypothetical protein FAZ98_16720 [Paraburkholderia acidisoli]